MMLLMAMFSCPWLTCPCMVLRTALRMEETNSSNCVAVAFIRVISW